MNSPGILNSILKEHGSIQKLNLIPKEIRDMFKTVWELPQKIILDMAIERGPYIDQSQSMNIHFETPTVKKLSEMLFYGWKHGLKTGVYYVRRRTIVNAIQFTLDNKSDEPEEEKDDGVCISCSG